MKNSSIPFAVWVCAVSAFVMTAAVATASAPDRPDLDRVLTVEQLREDADFAFTTIEQHHPDMYVYISKDEYAPIKEAMYKQLDHPMSRRDFYKLIAPAVAALRTGHTLIQPPTSEFKDFCRFNGKFYPFTVSLDGESLRVRKCHDDVGLPKGARILSINGENTAQVVDRFARRMPAEREPANPYVLEDPRLFWTMLWIDYGDEQPLELVIASPEGAPVQHTVEPQSLERVEIRKLERETLPEPFLFRYIPEHNAGLIICNAFEDRSEFKTFLKESFQEMQDKQVGGLIIDLRDNTGGDTRISDALLRYISDKPFRQFLQIDTKVSPWNRPATDPDVELGGIDTEKIGPKSPPENPLRFQGPVYVLSGPRCVSTGVALAATIQYFEIGELVGQETGDPTSLFGYARRTVLPNSNWGLSVPSRCYVAPGSKRDGRGVLPDHPVEPGPDDAAAGIDTVLEYALKLIDESPPAAAETGTDADANVED